MPVNQTGSIPRGSLLFDNEKNKWLIGAFIERIDRTEVYAAELHNDQAPTNYHGSVVIKIEKNQMGPLSTDLQFCIDNANPKDIDLWIKKRGLLNYGLGMPRLLGSGRYKHNGAEYYFIVTQKFGSDLRQLFSKNDRLFPEHTVYKVAFQTLHVLQYIHNRGYIHGDVREDNIVLDLDSEQRHVYLINFASTLPCSTKNAKVDFGGTIEYMSRDHHMGVPTKRGDLESLLYSMIWCLTGHLPWVDTCLEDTSQVHKMKTNAFQNIQKFVEDCFYPSKVPAPISEFALLLAKTSHNKEPRYLAMQVILCKGLKNLYSIPNGKLQFKVDILTPEAPKQRKRESIKGLGVSVELLVSIIAANCRNMKEVNLNSTKCGGLMDAIHRLTNLPRFDEDRINILRDAWQNDVAKLKTRVLELWKRKGIHIDIAQEEDKNEKTGKGSQLSAVAANADKVIHNNSAEGVRLIGNSAKCNKRKMEGGEKAVKRKRRNECIDEENKKLDGPNESNHGVDNPSHKRSLSPVILDSSSDLISSEFTNPSTPGCQSLPPTPLESKRFRSSVSQASSSGFNSFRSSQSGLLSEDLSQSHARWHDTYEYLNVWLEMKDKSFEAFGPISSEPSQVVACQIQKLRVFRDEFRMQQPQIDVLVEVLRKLPLDSEGTQNLDGILHRWRTQLSRLEEQGQKLSDACFYQLDSVLQSISDDLKTHSLDKEMEEQLLPKLKTYANQLESHQTLLANARIMAEQLSRVFGDSTLGSRVRAKFSSVNKLYHDLQQEIDSRKDEVKKSLGDGDQLYEKCKEILAWLEKELADMPENLLISADRKTLQQQFQNHEAMYQGISRKEDEVSDLLNKGGKFFTNLPNLDNRNLGKRYLYLIQSQWSLLKMRGQKILKNLQTCVDNGKNYDNAQNLFLPWLGNAEAWLENSKSVSLECEDDIQKQLRELSSFSDKVFEKSGEFHQNTQLGNTFIDSCDKDKENVMKNELITVKERWVELNNHILERKQFLEDTDSFNKCFCDLKRELEQCEVRWKAHDILQKAVKDPKLVLSLIKELREKTASLQGPLNNVRQKRSDLLPKARKQGTDMRHLLAEMDRVDDRITDLKAKLAENYNEIIQILEQKAVDFKRELQETRQVGRNTNSKRQKIIKSENVSQELIDLASDED